MFLENIMTKDETPLNFYIPFSRRESSFVVHCLYLLCLLFASTMDVSVAFSETGKVEINEKQNTSRIILNTFIEYKLFVLCKLEL